MSQRDALVSGAVLAVAAWTAALGEYFYSSSREEMVALSTAAVLLDTQRSEAQLLIDNFWDGSSENTFRQADARMATSYCAYPYDREVGALAASLVGSRNEMLVEFDTGPGSSVHVLAGATGHPSGNDEGTNGQACRDWIGGASAAWVSDIPLGHECFSGDLFRGHDHSESGELDFSDLTQTEAWGEHEFCWLAAKVDLYIDASEDDVTSLINYVGQDIFGLPDQGEPIPADRSLVFSTGVASLYDQAGMSRYPGSDHERWEVFTENSDGSLVRLGSSSEISAELWRLAWPFDLQGLRPQELLAQLQSTPERQYDVPIIGATLLASYALAAILLLAVFPLTFVSSLNRRDVRDWFSVGFPTFILFAGVAHLTIVGATWSGLAVGAALFLSTAFCGIRMRSLLRSAA